MKELSSWLNTDRGHQAVRINADQAMRMGQPIPVPSPAMMGDLTDRAIAKIEGLRFTGPFCSRSADGQLFSKRVGNNGVS